MSDAFSRSDPPPQDAPDRTENHPSKTRHADRVLCERCNAEMFRMHAVWRCPSCGYKTDCCGW